MSLTVNYKGSNIATVANGSSATLNTSGKYMEASVFITDTTAAGSAITPATTITVTPGLSINNSGLITATASGTSNITPSVTAGYVSQGTSGVVTVSGSNTLQLSTQGAATITPTENQQTAVASGKYTTGAVTVAGISSDYVGTAVTRRSSADLTVSGSTVTAPSGFYSSNASANVAAGSAFTPATTITTNPTITVSSNGLITATVSNYRNITPTVNAGYIVTGTSGRVQASGSSTYQLTVRGASSYTPTTTAQTIPSGIYLTGTQTINAIPSQYIVPAGTLSISANANGINVSQYASVDVNVPTPSFVTYYTGTSAPSNSLGSNGDIYLQTE